MNALSSFSSQTVKGDKVCIDKVCMETVGGEAVQVTVTEALDARRKQAVRNLFMFYFQDMAAWDDGLLINEYGLPVWHTFDGPTPTTHAECVEFNWWIRDQCYLYLIEADGVPAGFAFVNPGSEFVPPDVDFDMQDFFVLAKFRRQGVGEAAAKAVFDLHRGRWEVVQLQRNTGAIAFWHKVIGEYTGGAFTMFDDGARQRFVNR